MLSTTPSLAKGVGPQLTPFPLPSVSQELRLHWRPLLALTLLPLLCIPAAAQRHSGGSAPPTAPHTFGAAPTLIAPVSSGMGPIQFAAVNYAVPAPQSLTRQLRSDDDRTRAAALSAVGAPSQYLQRGHVAIPHSMHLEFAPVGNNDDLDAILTVELDQHILSAILVPAGDQWRRLATVFLAVPFGSPRVTPDTFVHTARSLMQPGRYRVVFRGTAQSFGPDWTESEAHLRILNDRAIVTMSFTSSARECTALNRGRPQPPAQNQSATQPGPASPLACTLLRRWLQPDPNDPQHRFLLVTGTGRLSPSESSDVLADSNTFTMAHLRSFSCQPFTFSDTTLRFEPIGPNAPCGGNPNTPPAHH